MKTTLSLILCVLMAYTGLQAQECPLREATTYQIGDPNATDGKGILLAAFIVTVLVGGCVIIWYVRKACPRCGDKVTLVLEKTTDWVNWVPILTNTVVLTNSEWVEMFRLQIDQMNEPNSYFRARLLR